MADDRFTSQGSRTEDLLKTQTVGLVNLADFRKRRAEVVEQSERGQDGNNGGLSQPPSGAATPRDRSLTPRPQSKKKRKTGKGKLSFAVDDNDDEEEEGRKDGNNATAIGQNSSKAVLPTSSTSHKLHDDGVEVTRSDAESTGLPMKRRLGPNTSIANAPKIMTKSALLKEAQEREKIRKEFLSMQEAVKASEIVIPFVFYDGSNVPGGATRMKKGDPVWLFLDKCRKLGADLRIGGAGEAKSRREWARVGVDDLMFVRKDIIIPHHYEFYYFVINKTLGHDSMPLFEYSSKPDPSTRLSQETPDPGPYDPFSRPKEDGNRSRLTDDKVEGAQDDPNLTKIVNRQWYERNKHIFPASTWEQFDPDKDYTNAIRRDAQGNAYFFSR